MRVWTGLLEVFSGLPGVFQLDHLVTDKIKKV